VVVVLFGLTPPASAAPGLLRLRLPAGAFRCGRYVRVVTRLHTRFSAPPLPSHDLLRGVPFRGVLFRGVLFRGVD